MSSDIQYNLVRQCHSSYGGNPGNILTFVISFFLAPRGSGDGSMIAVRIHALVIVILTITCLLTTSTYAATIQDDKQAVVNQFKTYLREIKSIAVDFSQEDGSGVKAYGKLLVDKPYNFRCNYYPPYPIVIIGNKNYVSVYDYEMKHVSRIKARENIFNFLLEDTVDFDRYFNVEEATIVDKILQITIYHTLSERRSKITFNTNTRQINKIEVFEDDNTITITFNHIAKVAKFDPDLFKLKNPDIFGPPNHLTQSEVEKKYLLSS